MTEEALNQEPEALEGLDPKMIRQSVEQLQKKYIIEQHQDMFDDILGLFQTKEITIDTTVTEHKAVYNVNRNMYGEWRAVVINNGVATDNIYIDDGLKQSFQTVDFEAGDGIIWLAIYTDQRRALLVQRGEKYEDFEVIENGDIQAYYSGEDIGYITNFLVSVGDVNTVFGDPERKQRFVGIDKQVREFMGKQFHPHVINFLTTALLTSEDPSKLLPTWEEAGNLDELETITYGIELKTDDKTFTKEQITRMLVWQNPTILDENGNEVADEEHINLATMLVNEQAVPGIMPNSVGNFIVTLTPPKYFKAVLLITEDHLASSGRFLPFKLYKRGDFRP